MYHLRKKKQTKKQAYKENDKKINIVNDKEHMKKMVKIYDNMQLNDFEIEFNKKKIKKIAMHIIKNKLYNKSSNPVYYDFLCMYFYHAKKITKFKYCCDEALKLNSNYVHELIGYYYDCKKDNDNAIKYYKIGVSKNNTNSMMGLCYCYYNTDQHFFFVKHARLAIENIEDDKKSIVMVTLANYYKNKKGYYKEAIYWYEKAIKNDGLTDDLIDSVYDLAFCYRKIEDIANMLRCYHLLVNLKQQRAILKLASYYNTLQEYETAIKYYKMYEVYDSAYSTEKITELKKFIFFDKMDDSDAFKCKYMKNNNDTCLICCEPKRILYNFNCDEKRDHRLCFACCMKSYNSDCKLKCLYCFFDIDVDKIIMEIKISDDKNHNTYMNSLNIF